MTPDKEIILKKYFTAIEDKGGYVACTRGEHPRVWMYDKKLIDAFSPEKLEKLLAKQTNHV